MRKYFVAFLGLALAGAAFAAVETNDFCDGYDDGYKEGWCYGQYSCIAPISPICPIPRIGEDGYKDGYNRGFVEGKRAKERN